MTDSPLLLYIPGMLPKPEPAEHREQLRRCLLHGLRAADETVAADLEANPAAFDIVSWTYDFYGEHRDVRLDLPDIDAALEQGSPGEKDIAEAVNWRRRLVYATYRIGDRFPFLISRLANEKVEVHIRDLRRYTRNDNDIAEHVRRLLKVPLEAAASSGRPVMLLAHSMGSVIAWDALWEMSRRDGRDARLQHWLTMGSPLGGHYLQKRILGRDRVGVERYPDNVDAWTNLAAIGDMTALDRTLANDFGPMIGLGLIDNIVDIEIFSHYRSDGELNVHNEYGYLMNEATARVVSKWWREVSR